MLLLMGKTFFISLLKVIWKHITTVEILQLVNEMITQLDYPFFKDDYEMIAIDLSKHLELDAGLRAMQQKKKKKNFSEFS